MKKYILILGLITLFVVTGCTTGYSFDEEEICFEDNCFQVSLAKKELTRNQGLSYQQGMEDNQGLLLVFEEEDYYSVWMKDMEFDLDIIWLNENLEVVFFSKNNPSCRTEDCTILTSGQPAMYVLEINAGLIDSLGIGLNDQTTIK